MVDSRSNGIQCRIYIKNILAEESRKTAGYGTKIGRKEIKRGFLGKTKIKILQYIKSGGSVCT